MTIEQLEARVTALENHLQEVITRGAEFRAGTNRAAMQVAQELQMTHQRWEGQKVRIDRILGTCDDLLKRFEAWKTVGNEMGRDVVALQKVVNTHTTMFDSIIERQDLQSKMLGNLVTMADDMRAFMREVQSILGTSKPEPTSSHPGDEGTATNVRD
jgi:hypothetical protein